VADDPRPPRTRTKPLTVGPAVGRVKTKELEKKRTTIVVDFEDTDGIASFFQELTTILRGNRAKKIRIIVEEVE